MLLFACKEKMFYIFAGPIIHEIGIYSGRINKDSDLGYVWKWSLLEEIINNNKDKTY